MAVVSPYKKYKRGQRQANVETTFEKGMMYSEGTVLDGYVKTLVNFDFTQDGKNALRPRAALVTSEVIVPDMTHQWDPEEEEQFLHEDTVLKYSKECVENGVDYRQFVFGKPDVDALEEATNSGKIWLATSKKDINDFESVVTEAYDLNSESSDCAYYTTGLVEIHDKRLTSDAKAAFPVGAFMGNSFYFFEEAGNNGALRKTEFDTTLLPPRYKFVDASVKSLTASEAVNYGYNMLSSTPYNFDDKHTAASFQMEGILPYDKEFKEGNTPKLMMAPKANTRVWFRCNYDATATYKIVWSWKEVAGNDDWTVFHTQNNVDCSNTPIIQADLVVPAKEIMVRCEAYKSTDLTVVERAMTIGFDFTLDPESTTRNSEQENYDLSTATGMMSWKNRLVVWGLPADPTIVFISDLDEPGYFPYPNNVTIFDEPIVAVTELMDSLIVFTKSKVHQVSLNDDGTSWNATVIQSNLYIDPWDKHLIQPVRNMVYFKSGNYYYMIVPKAQSTTGELTLAPITTPITDFFNHFDFNVSSVFKECYKDVDENGNLIQSVPEDLVTYYNFVDYENVHNFYVYRYNGVYVHFDIIYNVVSRYWKINIYEATHYLYPFRNDATQTGLMACTSVQPVKIVSEVPDEGDSGSDSGSGLGSGSGDSEDLPQAGETVNKRFVQIFSFDTLYVEDLYIPVSIVLDYDPGHEDISVSSGNLSIPVSIGSYDADDENLTIDVEYVRPHLLPQEWLWLLTSDTFVSGFNKVVIRDIILVNAAEILAESSVFSNRQMLDTGYRDANPFINKRYRELQLQINNLADESMEFGMDFQIAGEPRNTDFLYEVSQVIDEMHQDEGIVYLDATPYLPVDSEEIDKLNQWSIEPITSPSQEDIHVSLWKVRAAVSGKGVAPRLRLFTKKPFNYQLLGINWIYREMNMR